MSKTPLHRAISAPIASSELYCIFEEDGYGIGDIRGKTLYTSKERAIQDCPKGDETGAVMRLDLALDMMHDAYWAEKHKGSSLPSTFFRTDFYRKMHAEGDLNISTTHA